MTKYEEFRKNLETEKKELERKLEEALEQDKKKESILLDFEKQVKRVNTAKDTIKQKFDEKNEDLNKKMKDAEDMKKEASGKVALFTKQVEKLSFENNALKAKLNKLKTRKVVDVNSKFCINCNKDFNEKENFNWSCKVHRSEYGDHMWWCCGKRDYNAQGCKA